MFSRKDFLCRAIVEDLVDSHLRPPPHKYVLFDPVHLYPYLSSILHSLIYTPFSHLYPTLSSLPHSLCSSAMLDENFAS